MQRIFSVDELIGNDSFINYCNKADAKDTIYWEIYLKQYPGETANLAEARDFVQGLKSMLWKEEKTKSVNNFIELLNAREPGVLPTSDHIKASLTMGQPSLTNYNTYWWWAAASVTFIAVMAFWIVKSNSTPQTTIATTTDTVIGNKVVTVLSNNGSFRTGEGEKKTMFLSDGTKVTMNANSVLYVDRSFGKTGRLVKLEGEAFFDVKHDAASPFIVKLKDFDVKVLGTRFNVKSYAGDRTSEATLVKGKVEILLKNDPGKILFLEPNQKVVLYNEESEMLATSEDKVEDRIPSVSIQQLAIGSDGSSIVETGWLRNRLEIEDQTFADLKSSLERKYAVKIAFSDDVVKRYKFTAVFEKETIDQALAAMQLSYSFKYTKHNNEITIGK